MEYKKNSYIIIKRMDDQNGKDIQATSINNKIGLIKHIDDAGQLHGTWGGLAVIPEIDQIKIIPNPAFIRKNNDEIIKALKAAGYTNRYPNERNGNTVCAYYEEWIPGNPHKEYMCFNIDKDFEETVVKPFCVKDCGTDERLFIESLCKDSLL